jgi:hemerythrin-like domain-containing protein
MGLCAAGSHTREGRSRSWSASTAVPCEAHGGVLPSWRSGDEKAFAELLDAARLYADHIAQHINKENGVLFPMLEANIREVESGRTVEDVERENRHEEWLKTLEEVKRRLNA